MLAGVFQRRGRIGLQVWPAVRGLNMRTFVGSLALMVGLWPALAAGEGGNWYIGAGAGQSNYREICPYFESLAWSSDCNDDPVGWKVFIGRDFSNYFGLELSYADPGKAEITGPASSPGTLDVHSRLVSFQGKLEIPIGKLLTVLAKAGLTYFNVDYQRTGSYLVLPSGDDGLEPSIGLGVGVNLSKRVGIRAEWENFNDAVGGTGQGNIEMVTASLLYRF